MSSATGKPGQALGAIGGFGLGLSLWLPWYTVDFPRSAVDSVDQMSQQLGALGQLMRAGAQLINQLGPFHVTAWQVFHTMPAVLLGAAIIGGGLALLALTDRAGNTSQLTMLGGAVGAPLVVYRIAVPPGQGDFVHLAWGIYLALVSSLAMIAGGFLSSRQSDAPEPMVYPGLAPSPPAPSATGWDAPAASGWDATAAPALSVATDPSSNLSAGDSVPPPAA